MATKTLITVEEFDRLIEPDEYRYELDEGELIVMTRPQPLHNVITLRLTVALALHVETNGLGLILNSDTLFAMKRDLSRAPDISFLKKERVSSLDPREEIQGAPDLAVEVLSPNDSAPRLYRKIKQFFEAGTSEVWVLNPAKHEVEIWCGPKKPTRTLRADDVLTSKDFLPGFSIPIEKLFSQDWHGR